MIFEIAVIVYALWAIAAVVWGTMLFAESRDDVETLSPVTHFLLCYAFGLTAITTAILAALDAAARKVAG